MSRLPVDPMVSDAWQQLLTHALGQKQVGYLGGLIALPLLTLMVLAGVR